MVLQGGIRTPYKESVCGGGMSNILLGMGGLLEQWGMEMGSDLYQVTSV